MTNSPRKQIAEFIHPLIANCFSIAPSLSFTFSLKMDYDY